MIGRPCRRRVRDSSCSRLDGTLNLAGDFVVPAGPSPLSFGSGTIAVNGPGRLTNRGQVTFNAEVFNTPVENDGTILVHDTRSTFKQSFTNAVGATLRLEAFHAGTTAATFSAGLSNAGIIELTNADLPALAASLTVTGGTLDNLAGAVIRATAGTGGGTRTITAAIDDRGTIQSETTLNLTNPTDRSVALALNDDGRLDGTTGARIVVAGDLTGTTRNPDLTDQATVTMAGPANQFGPQVLEVMSRDLGNSARQSSRTT